jgi:hypothetical protein
VNQFYTISPSSAPPLRVGILLDSYLLQNCFAAIIDDIQACNFARIELLILNADTAAPAAPPQRRGLARKVLDRLLNAGLRQSFAWDLYQKWDRKFFGTEDDPLAQFDCSAKLAGIPCLRVQPITKGFVHRIPPDAIAAIRERKLDVILRFGFNILKGEILEAARCGIWSYHHGDNDFYRGGPAHFWEIYEKNPLSGVILQVLTPELDAGQVLCKAVFATEAGISLTRNRYSPYWGTTHFVIQKLFELHAFGWDYVRGRMVPPAPFRGKRKLYRRPTNFEMLRWLAVEIPRKMAARMFRRPSLQHWRIALRSGGDLLADRNMEGFRWVEGPSGHFYADPWLVKFGGTTWLFFEDFIYTKNCGVIACAEVLPDGRIGDPRTVLQKNYHLSYPCVFEYGGEHYMVPETKANHTVELYRATRFPYEWELVRVLFRGKAVDTTVWVEAGRCWFLVTTLGERGVGATLLLFSSDSPAGEWTYHPANPISTDVRTARCGGSLLRRNGKLYRTSQDCSVRYGSSFSVHEIVAFNEREYRETTVLTVDPSWFGGTGSHTYVRSDGMEAIDGSIDGLRSRMVIPAQFPPAEQTASAYDNVL